MGGSLSAAQRNHAEELGFLLKKIQRDVSKLDLELLLEEISARCCWYPESGCLQPEVWRKIGDSFHEEPRAPVKILQLWHLCRFAIEAYAVETVSFPPPSPLSAAPALYSGILPSCPVLLCPPLPGIAISNVNGQWEVQEGKTSLEHLETSSESELTPLMFAEASVSLGVNLSSLQTGINACEENVKLPPAGLTEPLAICPIQNLKNGGQTIVTLSPLPEISFQKSDSNAESQKNCKYSLKTLEISSTTVLAPLSLQQGPVRGITSSFQALGDKCKHNLPPSVTISPTSHVFDTAGSLSQLRKQERDQVEDFFRPAIPRQNALFLNINISLDRQLLCKALNQLLPPWFLSEVSLAPGEPPPSPEKKALSADLAPAAGP